MQNSMQGLSSPSYPLAQSPSPTRSRRVALRCACLGAALMFGGGLAQQALGAKPDVVVRDAWIRWLPAGLPAGGYMALENRSARPVALVNADSPQHYSSVKLHESAQKGGVMSMSEVDRVVVPAHSSVQFKPGGYHIMLLNAKHTIKPGQHVPVTLRFADGSHVTARFLVRKSNASRDGAQGEPMHQGGPTHPGTQAD